MLKIIKNKNPVEFSTPDRCHIVELLNDAASPLLSVARCRVEPGVTTQLHALKEIEETYLIEHGLGEFSDGGDNWRQVSAGDVIKIPTGRAQKIENIGKEDLVFLALCAPRFLPDAYINMEETEKI